MGRLGGPLGPPRRGPCPAWLVTCMVRLSVFRCGCGIKRGFPRCFKGTPRAVPDSSPRASAGLPLRLPQMLEPTDRTFFPPCLRTLSVGPRQRTRGSSPRSPAGVWALLQGLTASNSVRKAWHICQPASAVFQPASGVHAPLSLSPAGAISRRCSRASSHRALACSRRSGRA